MTVTLEELLTQSELTQVDSAHVELMYTANGANGR